MSTLRHPVGPQPKKVYWRRRVVVLAVLVALIAIVVLIVVRPGSGAEGETAPVATPSSSPAGTPADAGSTDAAAPPAAEGTPGAVDAGTDTSGEVPQCAAGNIALTPVTDATNYAAGVNPQLSFTIENTGAEPCTINAGTSQQLYTISSGDETYWVSSDCQTDASDTTALLEPGVVISSTPFSWDRTRSSADTCTATDRPQVPAAGASYHLNVQVAGITAPDSRQFLLE